MYKNRILYNFSSINLLKRLRQHDVVKKHFKKSIYISRKELIKNCWGKSQFNEVIHILDFTLSYHTLFLPVHSIGYGF